MNKTYLINLHKKHSIIALVATLISLFCYGYSLYGDFVAFAIDGISLHVFRYFTILTGMYGFLTTIMVIPFAVNGLLKKRFTYPRWMSLLHFSSIISTTLVFVFTLFFISWFDPTLAFGSYNFFLHIICPLLIMTSFYMTESPYNYNNIESAICMAPFAIYSVVYLINVVFRKTWDDIYNFNTFLPFYISMPLMYLLATLIVFILRRLNRIKNRVLRKQMSASWEEGLDGVSVKVDVYGLGRYMGLHGEANNINMNFDLLREISGRYNIKLEELTRAYSKGVIDGYNDPSSLHNSRNKLRGTY